MFLSELDVVNACLATMGETPLNTLEDDHSHKAAALEQLSQTSKIEQKRGWWFNSEHVLLEPDVSKFIYLPLDALAVKTVDRWNVPLFAQRGRRLYNLGQNNYEWDRAIKVDLVRLLSFADLPFHAADVVGYGAVIRFQRSFDGDTTRYQQLSQDYSRARLELNAEETRNRKPNLLATASNQVKMGMIGGHGTRGARLPYGIIGRSN